MKASLKDKISNVVAIIVAVGTVIASALDTVPADSQWWVWAAAVVVALLSYLTGKSGDLKGSA